MTRAELKQQAKDTLRGRWGIAIGMILIYELITVAISFLSGMVPVIGGIVSFIIVVPISFGFIGQMMKFSRNEEVGFFDFFKIGFSNFGKAWSIVGNTLIKFIGLIIVYVALVASIIAVTAVAASNNEPAVMLLLIPIVIAIAVVVVLFVMKAFLYSLTEYIGNDELQLSGKDVVAKSAEVMDGRRFDFFVLGLSFIGWAILASLTLGIGYLWLIPYMQVTEIKFYEDVCNKNSNNSDAVVTNE